MKSLRNLRLKYFAPLIPVAGTYWYLKSTNRDFINLTNIIRYGRLAVTSISILTQYKIFFYKHKESDRDFDTLLSVLHKKSALALRNVCEKNGGLFIKVGQHVAVMDHILPKEYIDIMKVLHKFCPTSDHNKIKMLFRNEFGRDPHELFSYFEIKPFSSASLAQVHKANLFTGESVVVKIQHPEVEKNAYKDLRVLNEMLKISKKIFPGMNLEWLVEETKRNLPLELDFTHEGENCEKAQGLYKNFTEIKFPKVYWSLSSKKVLTMEYCEGNFINDLSFYKKHGVKERRVLMSLISLYGSMIFEKGFIHCDPHPGNILINNTPKGFQIILLDHGLYQQLNEDLRHLYCKMWKSIMEKNEEELMKTSSELGVPNSYRLFASILTARSWKGVIAGLAIGPSAAEMNQVKLSAPRLFTQILDILNRIPHSLLLILKTNDYIRNLTASLKSKVSYLSFLIMYRSSLKGYRNNKSPWSLFIYWMKIIKTNIVVTFLTYNNYIFDSSAEYL